MSRGPARLALATAAVALCACGGLADLFVERGDRIKAPHGIHVKGEVECGSCHETIFKSTNLDTVDLPKEALCLGCHTDQDERKECAYCHTRPEQPRALKGHDRQLVMNHQLHLKLVKDDCTACHRQLPEPFWSDHLAPSMEACLTCHQKEWDEGRCELCHRDLGRFSLRPVAAFSHQAGFDRNHRLQARAQPESCARCHEQSFCSECHARTGSPRIDLQLPERVDRSFIHRNDFLSRHPIEAAADEATCQRCHGTDFCQSCHLKNGLVPGAPSGLNPHPAGFGQRSGHGVAARNDIVACAACHDQGAASNCVACHRSGGPGRNPHPQSWLLRHGREEIGRNGMCQICH
jgi:predicted CXXCH cytochrome family protein